MSPSFALALMALAAALMGAGCKSTPPAGAVPDTGTLPTETGTPSDDAAADINEGNADGDDRDDNDGQIDLDDLSDLTQTSDDLGQDYFEVPADVSPRHKLCQAGCRTTEAVACPYHVPDCVSACEKLLAADRCAAEVEAVIACRVAIGPSAYVCTAGKLIEPLPGMCQAEVENRRACSQRDAGT